MAAIEFDFTVPEYFNAPAGPRTPPTKKATATKMPVKRTRRAEPEDDYEEQPAPKRARRVAEPEPAPKRSRRAVVEEPTPAPKRSRKTVEAADDDFDWGAPPAKKTKAPAAQPKAVSSMQRGRPATGFGSSKRIGK